MSKKAMLIILDGWGHGEKNKTNAIHLGHTPFIDSCYTKYPNSELKTFGEHVGLPPGQMGNSEVGHLNIGAGRVVYQDFARINKAITDNELAKNPELVKAFAHAKKHNKNVHFLGLLSDGGIHSHQNHLVELCKIGTQQGVNNLFIHGFTDGRDTAPNGGVNYLTKLQKDIAGTNAKVGSLIGRYYAMDRDNRWERIALTYNLLVKGVGTKTTNPVKELQAFYDKGITDEFIEPITVTNDLNSPIATIAPNDVVICFNFRTDRCRQITKALSQEDFPEVKMEKIPLYFVTMTTYDSTFENIHVLFEKDNLINTIGEVIADVGLSQIRMAETEKYPHVTFFLSGGREKPFAKEERLIVNSPKVATYDLKPEMSATEVTEIITEQLNKQAADFICLNFANPDMVGHTGDQKAIIKAVEAIDSNTQKVVETAIKNDYQIIIIADHGNAEKNFNPDGSLHTAHTTNLVPCFAINTPFNNIKDGKLADVAPTLLNLLGIKQPEEMTGESLLG